MSEINTVIEVAIPLPLFQTFHYKLPMGAKVQTGSRVFVNFRNRKIFAYVIGFPSSAYPNTKEIIGIEKDFPIFSDKMLQFFKWISSHYATPLGEVIKSAIPVAPKKEARGKPYVLPKFPTTRPQKLTAEQIDVLSSLNKALLTEEFHPFLLHGVTGSGKTEVYLNLIQQALQRNKKALVLVPEISLTPQLVSRFENRFPEKIAVLHSRLTIHQRFHEWSKIKNGDVSIAIGTRSSLFAPLENVGVIIVDEEHDTSFKQEERLRYHARDLSLVRGQFEKAVVVLGSATPSLESYYNTHKGKLTLLTLSTRIDKHSLPNIEVIDLKKSEKDFRHDTIFSDRLLQYLAENLIQKHQSILFLNRRGYSPFLLCQRCGYVPKCPHCSVSLTVYTREKKLICHYCSHTSPFLKVCKDCQGNDIGPMGFGTEKVEEQLRTYFPEATIVRLDRSSTRKKNSLETILSDFANQKIDILIGTQMLAKGHDFPNVTLVGIILADISFNIPDFRAPERAFQLMTQVSGRAGRGSAGGRVVIQTFNPEHYSLFFSKSHDYRGFYETELRFRQELGYPPFSKLVHFKTSHMDQEKALKKIQWLGKICFSIQKNHHKLSHLKFLGPAEAPLSKIKDKYRFHLLLKSPSYKEIKLLLNYLFKYKKDLFLPPAIQIDVDPLNLL